MKLIAVPRDENYMVVKMASENLRWELGITPALFGWRIRASPAGDMGCTLDYCAGENLPDAIDVLCTVATIFGGLPEEITAGELAAVFPKWERRPIFKDECWEKLRALAAETEEAVSL